MKVSGWCGVGGYDMLREGEGEGEGEYSINVVSLGNDPVVSLVIDM